jgi:hypothetical protein
MNHSDSRGSADPGKHDRRHGQRFKVKVPLEIRTEGNEVPMRGATSDLSMSGCYVENMFPFPVGTALDLTLQLDDTLLVIAEVVTCDPQVGNGIRFEKMLPEDLEQLQSFLDKVASEAEKAKEAGAGET